MTSDVQQRITAIHSRRDGVAEGTKDKAQGLRDKTGVDWATDDLLWLLPHHY